MIRQFQFEAFSPRAADRRKGPRRLEKKRHAGMKKKENVLCLIDWLSFFYCRP
jgi:hypothetical protein